MQQNEADQLIFYEEADTFNLTVALIDDRFTIQLKDFVNWIFYEESYTNKDIGKQINKKMELLDVFKAFSPVKPDCDEELIKTQATGIRTLARYKFGTVVEHEGLPCFKIQKGGKITVYLNIMDLKTKSKISYLSQLKLNKNRLMTNSQILTEKQRIRNRSSPQKQQNKQLQKLQIQRQLIIQQSQAEEMLRIKNQMKKLIIPQSNTNVFALQNSKLSYVGADRTWAHYIFNQPIYANQSLKFKIRIVQSQSNFIMIGVLDKSKQKIRRSSRKSDDAMCYYGYSAQVYPSGKIHGKGFKRGDIVQVQANRFNCTVKYFVNGKISAIHTNWMLEDELRVFVPYVEMYNSDDCVEWLFE